MTENFKTDPSDVQFSSFEEMKKSLGKFSKKHQKRLIEGGLKFPFIMSESLFFSCSVGETLQEDLMVNEDNEHELSTKHCYYDC